MKGELYWHKKIHRSVGQNQKPRNKPIHIRSTNIWQWSQGYWKEKGYFLQWMVLRKLDIHLQKNETEPPAYMTYIIVLKWIKDLNKVYKHKTPKRNQREKIVTIELSMCILLAHSRCLIKFVEWIDGLWTNLNLGSSKLCILTLEAG